MDRRKLLWVGGLALTAAVGCTRHEVVKSDPYTSTAAQAAHVKKKSEPVAKEADLRPETLLLFADQQAQIAMSESAKDDERRNALNLAMSNYRRVLQAEPKSSKALIGLARLYSSTGEHDQALAILDAALTNTPEIAAMWFERGMVMGRQKKFEQAIKDVGHAQQLEPTSPHYSKAVGLMYARMGYSDEAVNWLRKSMSEADARYNVAQMMRHIGQEAEAKRQLQLSLKVDPQHAQTLAALGMAPAPTVDPLELISHQQPGPLPAQLTITVDQPAAAPAVIPSRPAPAKRSSVQIGFEPN